MGNMGRQRARHSRLMQGTSQDGEVLGQVDFPFVRVGQGIASFLLVRSANLSDRDHVAQSEN